MDYILLLQILSVVIVNHAVKSLWFALDDVYIFSTSRKVAMIVIQWISLLYNWTP